MKCLKHNDVIKWKYFPRYWPFVQGTCRSLVNFSHKGQWCEALMFSLICAWTNRWVKQSSGWWSEMPPSSLWRQCNELLLHTQFTWDVQIIWHKAKFQYNNDFYIGLNNVFILQSVIAKVPHNAGKHFSTMQWYIWLHSLYWQLVFQEFLYCLWSGFPLPCLWHSTCMF